jgi:hypothetical protein
MRYPAFVFLAFTALLFLIPSCATRPVFDFQTGSNLTPGATTTAQTRQLIGPPDSSSRVRNSNGEFIVWTYDYAGVAKDGTVAMDQVTLTFQNDLLQQYCFQWNSGPRLSRQTHIDTAVAQLKKGSSTKADAIAALGEPTGRAACRTLEKDSAEVCYWTQPPAANGLYRSVSVNFNSAGVILEIAQAESKGK